MINRLFRLLILGQITCFSSSFLSPLTYRKELKVCKFNGETKKLSANTAKYTNIILKASQNKDGESPKSDRKRDVIKKVLSKSILYPLIFLLSRPIIPPANAVIGYIPKGASGLRGDQQSEAPTAPKEIPEEILEKYGDNDRLKDLELKVYAAPKSIQKEEKEEIGGMGGLRPGSSSSSSSSRKETGVTTKKTLTAEEQLRLVPEFTPSSSAVEQHKFQAMRPAPVSQKSNKKSKIITIAQFSTFGTVGVLWARSQNAAERKRVQKGIELYESNRAEFFNITGKADSDVSLENELKGLNATLDDDDYDYDDEEEEEEEDMPPPPKKEPPKPKGPSGSSGSEGADDEDRLSDEDIERVKRMFDKK